MQVDQDSARVRFPPPLIYLGMLLLGFAWTGLTGRLGPAGTLSLLAGSTFLVIGAAVIIASSERFRNAGTHARPWRSSSSLVITGIYRFTRNPMYLGMAILHAGFAFLFDSFTALLLLPVAILLIRTQVIAREERYLLGKFGADYVAYKKSVPRWFPCLVEQPLRPQIHLHPLCGEQAERQYHKGIRQHRDVQVQGAASGPRRSAQADDCEQKENARQRRLLVELVRLRIDGNPHRLPPLPAEYDPHRKRDRTQPPSEKCRRKLHQHPGTDEQVDGREDPQPLDPERAKLGQAPCPESENEDEDRGRHRILNPALRLAGMNLHPRPHPISRPARCAVTMTGS
jgi:protein-S-isoprenylcysteine O-methyltransferase Ste14